MKKHYNINNSSSSHTPSPTPRVSLLSSRLCRLCNRKFSQQSEVYRHLTGSACNRFYVAVAHHTITRKHSRRHPFEHQRQGRSTTVTATSANFVMLVVRYRQSGRRIYLNSTTTHNQPCKTYARVSLGTNAFIFLENAVQELRPILYSLLPARLSRRHSCKLLPSVTERS